MKDILSKSTIFTFYLFLSFILIACNTDNSDDKSILEIIDTAYRLSNVQIEEYCQENDIDSDCIYEFKQHWTVYAPTSKIEKLKASLESTFPSLCMKQYTGAFYVFNRKLHCDQQLTNSMDHIIMTANLVADTLKQNEYMEYHRTQFEKWPEISKGFCNADFQELLLFRNGRQLMLVISIPEGKSLDELNPRTTENNPRVDTWNQLMSAYQEGIEDAPNGVVWVMFNKIRP